MSSNAHASQSPRVPLVAVPAPDDPLELLVHMAKHGDIDPWNVDIIEVANRYLVAAKQWQAHDHHNQTALRRTGKHLVYLAVLLRMKSDVLSGLDPFNPQAQLEDAEFDDLQEFDPNTGEAIAPTQANASANVMGAFGAALRKRFGSLDDVLHKRTSAKQPRQRSVTLADLLRELRHVEQQERERAVAVKVEAVDQRRRRVRDFSHLTTEDITQLAHDEFQENKVQLILEVLEAHLPTHHPKASLTLVDLAELSGQPWVVCYLALLFLEARQAVVLWQPHFYSDELCVSWPVASVD